MFQCLVACLAILVAATACKRSESRGSSPSAAPTPSAPPPATAADADADADATAAGPSAHRVEQPPLSSIVHVDGADLLRSIRERGARGALVNVWATWCGPCRRELPMLRGLSDNVKSRGLDVILVSVDEPESEPDVARTLEAEGYTPPYYVARRPLGAFKRALHPRWPGMIPVTFLFDAAGVRRYFWGGPVHEHELVPIVDGFLAGKAIDGEARYELAPGQTTP